MFINVIAAAPADADFVVYKQIGGLVILRRDADGIWDVCANMGNIAYPIFVAGVSARGLSLWSYESGQFVCGNVEQLAREVAA